MIGASATDKKAELRRRSRLEKKSKSKRAVAQEARDWIKRWIKDGDERVALAYIKRFGLERVLPSLTKQAVDSLIARRQYEPALSWIAELKLKQSYKAILNKLVALVDPYVAKSFIKEFQLKKIPKSLREKIYRKKIMKK